MNKKKTKTKRNNYIWILKKTMKKEKKREKNI